MVQTSHTEVLQGRQVTLSKGMTSPSFSNIAGSYGRVYRGMYEGKEVAVKVRSRYTHAVSVT